MLDQNVSTKSHYDVDALTLVFSFDFKKRLKNVVEYAVFFFFLGTFYRLTFKSCTN